MADNTSLGAARNAKRDEFYTQLIDIENELKHYRKHFKGKVVFCNCDDPLKSNFFRYFALNFNSLGLKQLIATCYVDSPLMSGQLSLFETEPPTDEMKKPHKIVINSVEDYTGDGAIDMADVEWLLRNGDNVLTELVGDGDFRSFECVELLKQADIVVTNPPFSLFRDYVALLMEYKKKFLIIGNKNALTFKEIFPLIKANEIWVGYTPMSREIYFDVPQEYIDDGLAKGKDRSVVMHDGRWMHRSQSIWFTNLDHKKRHEPLDLFKSYNPDAYPVYDNYNAIDVSKVVDIPCDFTGAMGVPISFLDKYSPEQFEILDARDCTDIPKLKEKTTMLVKDADGAINGKPKYARILIRNLNPEEPLE